MIPPGARVVLVFFASLAAYVASGTGATFSFSEIPTVPSYDHLAKSMVHGRLDIPGAPGFPELVEVRGGRSIFLPGPLPAVTRLPFALAGMAVPTGLMIALFCAGTVALCGACMDRLSGGARGGLVLLFSGALMLSGYALYLNALPLATHEATAGATFFLMAAACLYLGFSARGFEVSPGGALLFGLCLSAAFACWWAFFPAAGALGVAFLAGLRKGEGKPRAGRAAAVLVVCAAVAVGALLFYNHARFGRATDFGAAAEGQPFTEYAEEYGPWRYDHLQANLWNLFFRVPRAADRFPFILLPLHSMACASQGPQFQALGNVNELCASVLILFPVSLLALVPLWVLAAGRAGADRGRLAALAMAAALVVLAGAGGLRTVARMYWEFLPLVVILAFWGAARLVDKGRLTLEAAGVAAGASVALSFSLPAQAVLVYYVFYHFRGPLLGLFP